MTEYSWRLATNHLVLWLFIIYDTFMFAGLMVVYRNGCKGLYTAERH